MDYGRALAKWSEETSRIRVTAFQWNTATAQSMVKKQLQKNPPSLYHVNDQVRVRAKIPSKRKASKGRTDAELIVEARVVEADPESHMYKVCLRCSIYRQYTVIALSIAYGECHQQTHSLSEKCMRLL